MSVFAYVTFLVYVFSSQVQSFQIHGTTMTTRRRVSLSSSITDQTDTNTDSNMAVQLKDDLIALAASTNRGVSTYIKCKIPQRILFISIYHIIKYYANQSI